ncbi:zinc finger protein 2-like isoform X2 [Thalassophryne amazonica]|uniref:zinc finger protein 2-like isoform X2 n=1 Tax=Thalassophryne amazonica TaxID=390379 RepID=UPI0014713BEA|nr:zinc finger protein 2-like isoform X2 [Thalassophryne amazonica]
MDVKPAGCDTAPTFTNMSKGDALRSFVAETLAAATREILAVVERTVAGYEKEASGFREEIDRQRRQLEARTRKTGLEDAEEEVCDHLEDLNNKSDSRFISFCGQRMKLDEPHVGELENCVAFRICILDHSHSDETSHSEWKEVQCPRGLQEAEFLDLLRSSFPQMDGDKRFDVFTTDGNKTLHPLKLKTLSPEEIHRSLWSAGLMTSPLYIKLKASEEQMWLPRKDNKSEDCLSTFDMLVTSDDPEQSSTPGLPLDGSRTDVLSNCAESSEDMEADDGAAESRDTGFDEVSGTDGNWKPDKCQDEQQARKQKCKMITGRNPELFVRTLNVPKSNAAFDRKVCGFLQKSGNELIKHPWTQVDDPGSVSGESSEPVEALKDHLRSRHICEESLSVQSHEAGKPHRRSTCCEVFDLKGQLEEHLRMHSGRKTYCCSLCGKSLSDRKSLSRHKLVHSGERPHSCPACGKRFKLISTLQEHEKIHTVRERTYLCDVCCKMFVTSNQLEIHMRTHTKEKPYHCGECGKGFTTRGPLTIHMRIHTGETPYRCPECGWSFKRKTHLDNHLRIHSGQKPYVCGVCGKACARKTYLTVHMRTHNGERPYQCPVCDKAFTQSHRLKTHMKSHQVAEDTTTPD